MKKLLIISPFILLSFSLVGQKNDKEIFEKKSKETESLVLKNAIYLELGGNGLFYSVNYDKVIVGRKSSHLVIRAGFSPVGFISGDNSFLLPLEINVLLGKQNNFLEIGGGVSLFLGDDDYGSFENFATFRLGYRHQSESGLMMRAAMVPLISRSEKMMWVGLSVGYTF